MIQSELRINTNGPGLYEITDEVNTWLSENSAPEGLLTLMIQHTSASLLVQENADPSVKADLLAFFNRVVPRGDDPSMRWLTHTAEGPDDMPAHIKAAVMPVSLQMPVFRRALRLGTWQGVYVVEHRDRPHLRRIVLTLQDG